MSLPEKLWEAVCNNYNQGGRTKVVLPVDEVVKTFYALAANAISQLPEPDKRDKLIREAGPMIERMVRNVRARTDQNIWSRGKNLILPN